MAEMPAKGHDPVTVGNFTAVYERTGNDNFHTSIYEADYDGLLIARCNQNGRYFHQIEPLLNGLDGKRQSADLLTALASTHTRAMEALREAREVIDAFCGYGCPVCHGDCASANPPISLCPMQQAGAALSRIDAIMKEDTAHD
jgi:hypothetical protein